MSASGQLSNSSDCQSLPLPNTPDKEEDRYHYETTSGEKRICPGVVSLLDLQYARKIGRSASSVA